MKWLVTATTDIKFHQLPDGAIRHNYLSNNKEAAISSISWRNDGMQLVVVPSRGFTEIIDFEHDVRLSKTLAQVHLPNCATFQNKGNTAIAIGTLSGQVLLFDVEKDCVRHRFPTSASSIFQLRYNKEDTHLAAACSNGEVMLYGNSSSTSISSYRIPKHNSVSTMCFNGARSNILSAGSKEGDVVVWDINNNSVLCNYSNHSALVTCIAFSSTTPDLLVTSGLDQKFLFHDIRTDKAIKRIKVDRSITTFDICNFTNYIGLGCQNGNVLLYDNRNLKTPFSTFLGKKEKKIRHLLFQKRLSSGNETKTPGKLQNRSVYAISSSSEKSNRVQYDKSSDSFLVALKDLNLTRESEEKSETGGLRFKFDEEEIANYSNRSTSQKLSRTDALGFSSTPISTVGEQELSPAFAIIDPEEKFAATPKEDVKNIIKETVKEEFDNYKRKCNEELQNHCKEIVHETKFNIMKIQFNLLMKFNEMKNFLEK